MNIYFVLNEMFLNEILMFLIFLILYGNNAIYIMNI